jgi:hypothetical protein
MMYESSDSSEVVAWRNESQRLQKRIERTTEAKWKPMREQRDQDVSREITNALQQRKQIVQRRKSLVEEEEQRILDHQRAEEQRVLLLQKLQEEEEERQVSRCFSFAFTSLRFHP